MPETSGAEKKKKNPASRALFIKGNELDYMREASE